jgi:hypothetical protein
MEPEATPENAETRPAEPAPAPPRSKFDRRDPRARAKLLERLPALAYHVWSLRDDLSIDEDWAGVANLKVDSLLEPLESVAPGRAAGRP